MRRKRRRARWTVNRPWSERGLSLAAMSGHYAAQAALRSRCRAAACEEDRRSAGYWHGVAHKVARRAAHFALLARPDLKEE